MRPGSSLATTIVLMMVGAASACPEAERFKQKRAESGQEVSTELIGDLKTLKDSELTYTGRVVKALLQNGESVPDEENTTSYPTPPPAKNSDICKSDTCCIWRHVYNDMKKAMVDADGNCNDLARAAIRLGFHDAGTWSVETGPHGGADGSIVLAGECESRDENRGLQTICQQTRRWFDTYKQYGVGMADLIQMGHNAGTKLCLSGPTVRTFVGRKDRSTAAPHGNLPTQEQSADELIALFGNKTISPAGLAALVGAHTSARQRFVDVSRAGLALDSSPEIWDTKFYDETLAPDAPDGVFRLPSDVKLSRHPRTNPAWQSFSGFFGLFPWLRDYSREYVRLSLLGVDNINGLTECTRALSDDPPGPVDPGTSAVTGVSSTSPTLTHASSSKSTTSTHISSSKPPNSTHISSSQTPTSKHISSSKPPTSKQISTSKSDTSAHVSPSTSPTSASISSKPATSKHVSSKSVTTTQLSHNKTTATTSERNRPMAVKTSQTSTPVVTAARGSATAPRLNHSSSLTSHVSQASVAAVAGVKALMELSTKFTFEIRRGLVAIHNLGEAAAVSWRLVYDLDADVRQRFRFEICEPQEQGFVVTKFRGQYLYGYALEVNTIESGVTQLLCDNGVLYHVEMAGAKVITTKPVKEKASQSKGRVIKCTGTNACQETPCKSNECNSNLVVSSKATVSFTYEACQPLTECHCVRTCVGKDCRIQKPGQGAARPPLPPDQVRTTAAVLGNAVSSLKLDTEASVSAARPLMSPGAQDKMAASGRRGGQTTQRQGDSRPAPVSKGAHTALASPGPVLSMAASKAHPGGGEAGSRPYKSTSAPSGLRAAGTSGPIARPSNAVVSSSGRLATHILGAFAGIALLL